MKWLWHILVLGLLLAVMVRCGNSPDSTALTGTTSQSGTAAFNALKEIDSLMWKQPDSALTVMLKFAASAEADSLNEFDGHYCQMLISELLYKNDYGQSNREELLKAVGYFDSIIAADGYKTDSRRGAPRASAKNVQNIAFLDARVHYINGVGFYEKGDVVNACAEYLRTLEVMEAHFEEKEFVGHKARFLAYTYNRLGDLFSAQYMMDPAITCYEKALVYCKIEPTSPTGISNILYRIGKQYDKKNEIENARQYFGQALECMTDTNNLVYRDIVSSKAVSDYRYGIEIDQPLDELKQIVLLADNETERLYRYMTIGALFFEEGVYDSALYYLIPVFDKTDNILFQIQAAEYLRNIYDSIEELEKADVCVRFLVEHKKSEGENKALVSKLEDMFKDYMDKKQKKEAEAERERSINKTLKKIVPVAVVVVLTIILFAKLKSKKLLKEQQGKANRILGETEHEHKKELKRLQTEAEQKLVEAEEKHQQKVEEIVKRHEEELKLQKDKSEKEIEKTKKRHEAELEAERLAYQKEQEALRQNLQQREVQVSALEKALEQQHKEVAKQRTAFLNEEICQKILEILHGKHITSRDISNQHGIGLNEEDFKQLKDAVERHYKGFDNMLLGQCASLNQSDLTLCHLHLLGLSEGEIGALKGRTYSAIKKQNENLQEKIGMEENLSAYILKVAEGLCGTQIDARNEAINGTIPHKSKRFLDKNDRLEQESGMKYMQKSMQKIVMLISASPDITLSEMASQLGMSRNGVDKNIRKLKEKGIIRRVGPDKGGHWEVIE